MELKDLTYVMFKQGWKQLNVTALLFFFLFFFWGQNSNIIEKSINDNDTD